MLHEFEQGCLGSGARSSIGCHDRNVRIEIETLTYLFDAVMEITVKGVDIDDERNLDTFEVLDCTKRIFEASEIGRAHV